ncbi:MAG: outer membrane lipoprotein-sorting protein [Candidatus Aminicenantes bacterium]|nr:outer membrane lipoprotein-sorting protein [Candidatus Aminicenantes bacterium]
MRETWLPIVLAGLAIPILLLIPQAPDEADAAAIVRRIDALYRSESSEALVEMEIVTPHWQRTLKMRAWSSGMDKTFIRILEPKKETGIATLRLGNEMWNFLPKINKVMKIPPSMMMSSWMGSDFTNDDLVKEFTFLESYHFELTSLDAPEEGLVYVKCVPKEGLPIVWGHVIIAARRADAMPVWQRFFDEKGNLVREMLFREVKSFGNRRIPSVMELIPQNKEGQKTVLRYLEARFDIELDPDVFTLRNLRRGI